MSKPNAIEKTFTKVMKDTGTYFTEQQMEDIFRNAPNETMAVMFFVLANTGRRISEVLMMKGNDLTELRNVKDPMIAFNILKKRKPYQTNKPVTPEVSEMLLAYAAKHKIGRDEYVFQRFDGSKRPITRQLASYYLKKTCKKLGINKLGRHDPHLHCFRHGFVVACARNSSSIADFIQLAALMEHSDLSVTNFYLKEFAAKSQSDLLNKTFSKRKQ